MLQKFALACKTKTISFFTEDEEEEEQDEDNIPEEIITGQRVVVLKPDPTVQIDPQPLISSLFTTISFFRSAYLQLQIAHFPFNLEAIQTADSSAISHLRRLSALKHSQNPNPSFPVSAHFDAEVQENQSLLRTFETVVNTMQAEIDCRDAVCAELKKQLLENERENDRIERRLEPLEEKVESLLTVGVFNSVLKDSCRVAHRFVRGIVELMKKKRWDLEMVAKSIYPDVGYAKSGHCGYAILSCVCLAMFESFDLDDFGCGGDGVSCLDCEDWEFRRRDSLRKFIEFSNVDPLEMIGRDPSCDFARFCDLKFRNIVSLGLEESLFGNEDHLRPSSLLFEMFVSMASSIWMLHKLAWAYDPMLEIFQVGGGVDFSMVYMESVCQKSLDKNSVLTNSRPKVGFTVFPGFRVGRTVIQCWVYLDMKKKI